MSNISDLKSQKYALKRASVEARHRLLHELHESSDRAGTLLRNTAIVSGALVTGYMLFRLVSGASRGESKKDHVEVHKASAGVVRRSVRNRLKQRIVQEVSLYLLGIARDQLIHYLTKKSDKNHDATGEAAETQ